MVQQLQLERQQAEVMTSISDIRTNQQRTEQALLELQHQIRAATQRLSAAEQDLAALKFDRAPMARWWAFYFCRGCCHSARAAHYGHCAKGESLTIESRVQPHFIDRVKTGDAVDIRFSTFPTTRSWSLKAGLIPFRKTCSPTP